MVFKPLFPESSVSKPISHLAQGLGFKSGSPQYHSNAFKNDLRANFTIQTWLLVGACLQSLLVLLPLSPLITLSPCFTILAWKIAQTSLQISGVLSNASMKDAITSRFAALFPEKDGSFNRPPGGSVVGGDICVFLLKFRNNHPLGVLDVRMKELGTLFAAMVKELEDNVADNGFLGASNYHETSSRTAGPETMAVMYFRTPEDVYRFSQSDAHRTGLAWWTKGGISFKDITIGHEMYSVPAGRWETIYHNSSPSGFAATSHLIESQGGVRSWACPIVDARDSRLASTTSRMDLKLVHTPKLYGDN